MKNNTDNRNMIVESMNETEILKELLNRDQTQLGDVYRAMENGITNSNDLVHESKAANPGAVANLKTIIKAVRDGDLPTSSSLAILSARAIKRILSTNDDIPKNIENILLERRSKLLEISGDSLAVKADTEEILDKSEKLGKKINDFKKAIYVYTFPTYYRVGVNGDTDMKWLKIGKTTNSVWERVSGQNRVVNMPEDPIIIRIYHSDDMDVDSIEKNSIVLWKRCFTPEAHRSTLRLVQSGSQHLKYL